MASWASVAAAPKPAAPAPAVDPGAPRPRVAVLDANALIGGAALAELFRSADLAVTTPEALAEVRDAASRAALAALPLRLETREPDEAAVKAVVRFARLTGDAHALSAADVRLIALARTLEAAYYGEGHLRAAPPPPRLRRAGGRRAERALPGWGAAGGDWADMDRLNEEEEAAAAAALGPRPDGDGDGGADDGDGAASRVAARVQELSLGGDGADEAGGDGHSIEEEDDGGGSEDGSSGFSDGDGDDDGWEVAARTPNVARRRRRRAIRAAQRAAEAAEAAAASSDDDGDGGDGSDAETTADGAPPHPAGASAVVSMTADFAMQNVILQMGLRLGAPDGRALTRVARWALRCAACFAVTKEAGRVFCPRCGNAALDRVRLSVTAGGAEQAGVRHKHVLRGTRFPLPKPKGGRARDPILREDQLLAKAGQLRRQQKAEAGAGLDPFAPEYGEETWHQAAALRARAAGAGSGAAAAAAAAVLPGWRKNPNERKHVATNRRRK